MSVLFSSLTSPLETPNNYHFYTSSMQREATKRQRSENTKSSVLEVLEQKKKKKNAAHLKYFPASRGTVWKVMRTKG